MIAVLLILLSKFHLTIFSKVILSMEYFSLYDFCSDFRYESYGIFVLGVDFLSSDKFRLFNYQILTDFFIIKKLLFC